MADYVGAYEHPGYGVVTVALDGGGLLLTMDRFRVPFEHFHFDVFRSLRPRGGPPMGLPIGLLQEDLRVTFGYGQDGKINTLSIPMGRYVERDVADIVFRRKGS